MCIAFMSQRASMSICPHRNRAGAQAHPRCPMLCLSRPFFSPRVYRAAMPHRAVSEPQGMDLSMSEVMVDEIMVPHPVCFHVNQTLKDAARLMVEKDISCGPVVDDAGNLVGLLTESDLMWKGAGVPQDHYIVPPVFIGAFDMFFFLKDNNAVQSEVRKILAKQVSEAMTKDVRSVQPNISMAEASRLMLQHKLHHLPVVEGTKVIGVITRHDVLRALISTHSPLLQ